MPVKVKVIEGRRRLGKTGEVRMLDQAWASYYERLGLVEIINEEETKEDEYFIEGTDSADAGSEY